MLYNIRVSRRIPVESKVAMRTFLSFLLLIFFAGAVETYAQGGKAEPSRIEFARGRQSAAVTGTLSNGREAEYVFGASKGQTVVIKNSSRTLFDFRVFNQGFDFETEFESSPTLTFEIPETGDYLFFVRKKQVKSPRTARYSLTLSIK